MEFLCKLTTEQRDFLLTAQLHWLGQRGYEEYRRSFGVIKSVLEFNEYHKAQMVYIDNVRIVEK